MCLFSLFAARNAIVVILTGAVAAIFAANDMYPFTLTKGIKPGLPEFKPPAFEVTCEAHIGNITTNETAHTYSSSEIFSVCGVFIETSLFF